MQRTAEETWVCEGPHKTCGRETQPAAKATHRGVAALPLQELLLILEEYWERHPELHGVPIYQVGKGT